MTAFKIFLKMFKIIIKSKKSSKKMTASEIQISATMTKKQTVLIILILGLLILAVLKKNRLC